MTWAGHLTARSDVYSFGVVLLELLTGRKSVDKTRPSKEQNLVDWARPKLNDKKKLLQIIDPRLENQYSLRAAQKACSLAYYCLSQNPKARPLMSDVVETLEPLQSCSDSMSEVPSSSTTVGGPFVMGGISNYRMQHRFAKNVGPGSSCRSPNPNCSPGGPAACRVRWPFHVVVWRAFFEMTKVLCLLFLYLSCTSWYLIIPSLGRLLFLRLGAYINAPVVFASQSGCCHARSYFTMRMIIIIAKFAVYAIKSQSDPLHAWEGGSDPNETSSSSKERKSMQIIDLRSYSLVQETRCSSALPHWKVL